MLIRSKKTKLVHEVTEDVWESMQRKQTSRLYTIEQESVDAHKAAKQEVANADYAQLLKNASAAIKEQNLDAAKEYYRLALEIKETPMIRKKFEKL